LALSLVYTRERRDPSVNFPYAYVGADPVSFVDPQGTDR
jgi:hypothetical protein